MFITESKTIIMFLMNSTCVLSIRNIIDMFITESKTIIMFLMNSTCVLSIRNIINMDNYVYNGKINFY